MSQRMYVQQRATIVKQIQRDYGNRYVQRLVSHIKANRGETAQPKRKPNSSQDVYQQTIQRKEVDKQAGELVRAAIQRLEAIEASPGGLAGQREWHP